VSTTPAQQISSKFFTLSELDLYYVYDDMTDHTISNAYMKSKMSVNAMQNMMASCI